MPSIRSDVQPLDKAGALYALAALAFAAIYQAIWYLAPEFMEIPMWGSAIPLSMPFGILALFMPLFFAWLIARKDDQTSTETYETSGH
jgi:hypothetical protein